MTEGLGSNMTKWRRSFVLVVGATVFVTVGARDAKAACFPPDLKSRVAVTSQRHPLDSLNTEESGADAIGVGWHFSSVVGLWDVAFLAGSGPDVLYQGFQQWHLGGTEVMVDNGVAPAFGNVCVGVWSQIGSRRYKLKHVTFNWDAAGNRAGTFELRMTVQLNRNGRSFTGTYSADSFDLSGNVIPNLHVEGRVTARRIGVD